MVARPDREPLDLLARCVEGVDGASIAEGAFGPGPAVWVGKREVAHFDDAQTLDVRLTKQEIRGRRDELLARPGVQLRGPSSDWLEIDLDQCDDDGWAIALVQEAVAVNAATAPAGDPPTGADLARRRRFH